MKLINLLIIVFFIIFFFILPIFAGEHFCYLPVEDKGPGTFGCFYSSAGESVKLGIPPAYK
jgi:hypothetical protein